MSNAAEHISKARVGLVVAHPFFASLAFRLNYVEDSSIPTMCTEGRAIRYNPDFTMSLSLAECKGVIAHEVLHCAGLDFARRGNRDPELWNVAADYAINLILREARLELPEGCLYDPAFRGMSKESIYAALCDDQAHKRPRKGNGNDPGGWNVGGVTEPQGGAADTSDLDPLIRDWTIAATQAAQTARAKGKLPGSIARMIGELTAPRIDPADLLAEFVERTAASDYTFARVNRRFAGHGIIMPGMLSDTLPPLVLANDTSGSRGDEQITEFAGMVSAILTRWQVELTVLHVDADVRAVEELTSADLPLSLKPSGGGGTDFAPAFDWVAKSGREFAGLIYFTDMYGDFPQDPPPYPVIWVSDSSIDNAPFGRVVRL